MTLRREPVGAAHVEPLTNRVPPEWPDQFAMLSPLFLEAQDSYDLDRIHALRLRLDLAPKEAALLKEIVKGRARRRRRAKMTRQERYEEWLADEAKKTPESRAAHARMLEKGRKRSRKRTENAIAAYKARAAADLEARSTVRAPTVAEREQDSGPRRKHLGIVHRDLERVASPRPVDGTVYPLGPGRGRPTLRVIGAESDADEDE